MGCAAGILKRSGFEPLTHKVLWQEAIKELKDIKAIVHRTRISRYWSGTGLSNLGSTEPLHVGPLVLGAWCVLEPQHVLSTRGECHIHGIDPFNHSRPFCADHSETERLLYSPQAHAFKTSKSQGLSFNSCKGLEKHQLLCGNNGRHAGRHKGKPHSSGVPSRFARLRDVPCLLLRCQPFISWSHEGN